MIFLFAGDLPTAFHVQRCCLRQSKTALDAPHRGDGGLSLDLPTIS